ncbi:hypothetical protein DESUT3_00410 [Desulfuromonas versatilis]|uniref:Uncharacterized protein n=1 Tax=Desulfuromonas versatilis TaxID=2802975 RepID=A0ABN6DRU4_9BACT|nr:hypothetical protein [Desulfuromonas versatilis]BCR02972.1 hypothetical protein DESUT3_00410 [Desulfuromonas versatilis]
MSLRGQGIIWLAGVLVLPLSLIIPTPSGEAREQFLDSTIALDEENETITLPLFEARSAAGDTVWYIVTEASDRDLAREKGVNWSPKLVNALGSAAVQTVTEQRGLVVFSGTVDFTPEHRLVPNPETGFPPELAEPGSLGDAAYSPLITSGDGVVLNAPQVANGSGLHDKVVAIDLAREEVTLRLTPGLYHGKNILYLSTDASDPTAAALEESTFAPNLNAAPGLASNAADSARAAIVAIVNGETGVDNPERQGLSSALLGEGSPLNITEVHPRNRGRLPIYSPLWDVHPAVWTEQAIAAGERRLLDHHEDVADLVEDGALASGGFGPMNPALGGLRAAGFIVNCPVMSLE